MIPKAAKRFLLLVMGLALCAAPVQAAAPKVILAEDIGATW